LDDDDDDHDDDVFDSCLLLSRFVSITTTWWGSFCSFSVYLFFLLSRWLAVSGRGPASQGRSSNDDIIMHRPRWFAKRRRQKK